MTQAERMNRLPKQFFATLTRKVAELQKSAPDLINLGQGNPDQPTPPHIVDALCEAARDPVNHRYGSFRGESYLREAICSYYEREFGVSLDPAREVAILFGGKAGLVEVSQCILNEGDLALVPDPGYPDYQSGVALAGAHMEYMPLLRENDFLPDYRSIDEEVARRAKLMFLNYPNNPTAAVATPDFFEETVRFAKRSHTVVVHDFAYGAIGFSEKPVSFLATKGAKDVGIEVYTLSKTYNMAGWRVGFALGREDVIESLNLYQDHAYVSLFGAIQRAAAVALTESQASVRELVDLYRKRRDRFLQTLSDQGVPVLQSQGSFFVWLPVPEGVSSESFTDQLLYDEHVAVAAGNGFGRYGEGYVRIGLLTDETRLYAAALRIARMYHRAARG